MKPRSMEEKISYLLFLMGFAGLVCTAALCSFVFHKAFREQAWTALEREADLVAAGCAQVDAPSQLETYVDGSLRITLIASDGSVLFESATNQTIENHQRLPEIQLDILRTACRYVKDGGLLVYSTCTVNIEENECVIEKFLAENSDFHGEEFPEDMGDFFRGKFMTAIFSKQFGGDGFFICRMRKGKK